MEHYVNQINEFIESNKENIISLWKELVNMEGKTEEKDYVDQLALRLKVEMDTMGMETKLVEVSPDRGRSVIGIMGKERKGKPVIFGGHFDTVFKKGTFGENPFRIEDGKAYGPGALDMKGGIVIALYIIKALNHIGYEERPLKMVLSSDEETGHQGSTGDIFFEEEGKGGICAFNMETGPVDNSLCIGRSTAAQIYIKVIGVEAHSGNNFTAGRNAIVEASHKIIELHELTNLEEGTTVNTGVIKGGTVFNSIPGNCEITVDLRFRKASEMERVLPLAEKILNKTFIDGTKTDYEIIKSGLQIYDANEEVHNFFNYLNEIAKKYDYPEFGHVTLGGGSDAGTILKAGTPVICSCGVRGEFNHTAKEYAVVDSMFERAKLYSIAILNLKDKENFK